MLPIFTKIVYILLLNCCVVFGIEKDKKCLDGVCTFISQCPVALENLQNGIFPIICGFEDAYSEPTICCQKLQVETSTELLRSPEQVTQPNDKVVFLKEKTELTISKKKCKEYALQSCEGVLQVTSDEIENIDQRFPHTALIGYGEYSNIQWKCSGSLISEFYVITAARCEYTPNGYAQWVRLGTSTSSETSNYTHNEIVERIIHPKYVHPYFQNDIALFKLKEKVEFNAYVHPICLFDETEIKHDKLLSVGFSIDRCVDSACHIQTSNDFQIDTQLATNAQIEDLYNCRNIFHNAKESFNGLLDQKSSICTRLTLPQLETCQGVVGDPLLREIKTGCPSFYELIGVLSLVNHVSNGISCYYLNTTMINTKVSHFLPWIEKIVWKYNY
ncbi:serine protease snake-like [Planococcus citri]|uniref:serine protease snake-like n=1 Tax=Planococcus citri TaxID=170843 RepID=UPI0031F83D70